MSEVKLVKVGELKVSNQEGEITTLELSVDEDKIVNLFSRIFSEWEQCVEGI